MATVVVSTAPPTDAFDSGVIGVPKITAAGVNVDTTLVSAVQAVAAANGVTLVVGGGGGTVVLPSTTTRVNSVAGPPTSGIWAAGSVVIDANGDEWTCKTGGQPGTWIMPGATSFVAQGLPSYAGARSRSYDPSRHVYGGDIVTRRPIRAALGKALAGTALVPILCMGDSETAGWKATPGTNDPVMQLRKLFSAAGFPVTGGWVFPNNGTATALDPRWAFVGPWQGGNQTVNNYVWVASTGATATFTPDLAGTVMEFVVFSTSTVTINYSIDGGASTPFVVNAGAARKVQVTGLSSALHTLVITTTSATTVWVGAARLRQTTGLTISNAGIFGSYASDWLPTALTSAYFNPYNLTLGLETPALVLLGLGANEAIHSGHTVSGMTSTLTTIVTGVKAICPVVMKTYMPSDDTVVAAANPGTVWTDWVKGMYDTADATSVMLIDHTDAMGTNAVCNTLGLADADKIHPTAAGYSVVARRDQLAIAA
jgi:lysophospholipase L1-like esterase